jgi:hypothetical protein
MPDPMRREPPKVRLLLLGRLIDNHPMRGQAQIVREAIQPLFKSLCIVKGIISYRRDLIAQLQCLIAVQIGMMETRKSDTLIQILPSYLYPFLDRQIDERVIETSGCTFEGRRIFDEYTGRHGLLLV